MEPTIGRIIWVKLHNSSDVVPAIIHAVHGPECVSVNYFSWEGAKALGSVTRSEGLQSEYDCWDWMPYQKQKGQAEAQAERAAMDQVPLPGSPKVTP